MKACYLEFASLSMSLLIGIVMSPVANAYRIVDGVLDNSAIYPGTTHIFKISVPDGYDGSVEAALYLGLDGILCNAPAVIDRLCAAGKLPTMIGVYLQPGTVLGADGEVLRWNRSNEFDATDSTFASFIERELLPQVKRVLEGEGLSARISDNPAHRMIFGLSSGGIAAFTAAWHRPDLFGKVFMGCATLVPMRGGHNLQAIVRKNEPRPLKIVIQDTYHDTWNPLFGSWYEANRLMASALNFAGYDMREDWTEGVHSVARSSEIFPAVMEWMWADSKPADDGGVNADDRIVPGLSANNFLSSALVQGEAWKRVEASQSVQLSVGADMCRASYPDGSLSAYRHAEGGNFLWQALVVADGTEQYAQRFYWLHTYDNCDLPVGGMAFDGNGNLWVLTGAGLQICDQNGRVRAILDLPRDIVPSEMYISICPAEYNGEDAAVVYLLDKQQCPIYSRILKVAVPQTGVRPDSQGQA